MTLGTDIQSWYSTSIIKEAILKPDETYRDLVHNEQRFINKIRDFINQNAKVKYIHPDINIISSQDSTNEYFLFDLPIVDPSSDKRVIVAVIFKFKEKLFSRKIISVPVFRIVQEFSDKELFEVNAYISLIPYVLFNSRMAGFIRVNNIKTLMNDLITMHNDESFTDNWEWAIDLENDEEEKDEYLENIKFLHEKYVDFEDKELFQSLGVMSMVHSLFLGSVFSMMAKFNCVNKTKSEKLKTEFLNNIFAHCYVSAMFLGIEKPWSESIDDKIYFIEIRKFINVLVYITYQSLQQYISVLPKGNINGLVEMSYEMYGSIRNMIENSYWYGSQYILKKKYP